MWQASQGPFRGAPGTSCGSAKPCTALQGVLRMLSTLGVCAGGEARQSGERLVRAQRAHHRRHQVPQRPPGRRRVHRHGGWPGTQTSQIRAVLALSAAALAKGPSRKSWPQSPSRMPCPDQAPALRLAAPHPLRQPSSCWAGGPCLASRGALQHALVAQQQHSSRAQPSAQLHEPAAN